MPAALHALVTEIAVTGVERLSPSFVRVEFGSPALAQFGVEGPYLDQRIKLVFPTGHKRTYSVRDVVGDGAQTRLIVDFVLHLDPGRSGPATRWAARARPGDRLGLIGPRRDVPWGGIEFAPPDGTTILLAGDETAVPAVGRILADVTEHVRGAAFLEVPHAADMLPLVCSSPDVSVTWLPRGARPHGQRLLDAVVAHLPSPAGAPEDGLVWETPSYSASGQLPASHDVASAPGLYFWVAGEAAMVARLRRHVVHELGLPRRQGAFMGYWRDGRPAAE